MQRCHGARATQRPRQLHDDDDDDEYRISSVMSIFGLGLDLKAKFVALAL